MKRDLPPYVYRKPSGAVYFYRRGEPSVRIRAEIGTAEFAREYALAMQGAPAPNASGRTFRNLIRSYQRSERWNKLAPRTQADYGKVLAYIEAKFGAHNPADMQRQHVIRAQKSNAETVRFANYIVQVLVVLFEQAIDIGWLGKNPVNPAKGVPMIKGEKVDRVPWPADMVEAYRKAAPHGTRARILLELGIGTGQRPGDLCKMRWDAIKDGGIEVTQGKTKARLWIPLTRALREALDAMPRRGLTICAQANGKPTTYRGCAQIVLDVRKKIGAEAYDMHSWRYTAAAELAAAGCDDEMIKAVTGHKTGAMVAQYAGASRQKARAVEAMKRREG